MEPWRGAILTHTRHLHTTQRANQTKAATRTDDADFCQPFPDLYDELLRWPTRYRSTLAIWSEEEALQRESEDLSTVDFNL